jgi:hypothetical protein
MEFEHVVKEDLGSFGGCGGGSGGDEVDHLGKGIYKDNNGIKSRLGAGQLGDEVHGDLFPWLGWDGEWLEEASRRLLACLDALAGVTGLHIVPYVIVESGPVEKSMYRFEGTFYAWVSSNGDVMMVMQDLGSEGPPGNANAVEVVQEEVVGGEGVMFEEGGWDAGGD